MAAVVSPAPPRAAATAAGPRCAGRRSRGRSGARTWPGRESPGHAAGFIVPDTALLIKHAWTLQAAADARHEDTRR